MIFAIADSDDEDWVERMVKQEVETARVEMEVQMLQEIRESSPQGLEAMRVVIPMIVIAHTPVANQPPAPSTKAKPAWEWDEATRQWTWEQGTRRWHRRLRWLARQDLRLRLIALRKLDRVLGWSQAWRRRRGGLWFRSAWFHDTRWMRLHAHALGHYDHFACRWQRVHLEAWAAAIEDYRDHVAPGDRFKGVAP